MLFGEQLKKWFAKFQKYKVTYKGGFFQFINLANSPATIVESFDNMPFCTLSREKKLLTSRTPFLNAQFYYVELEEGLWIFVSDMRCKKNIEMIHIYEKSLPIEYNFFNLHYHSTRINSKSTIINGMVLTDKTWSLLKAGKARNNYHFENSHENNITVYFTNAWLNKQLQRKSYFTNSGIERFFQSDNTYLILPDTDRGSDRFYNDFLNLVMNNESDVKNDEISSLLADFFKQFIDRYNSETLADYNFKLSDADSKYIKKAEKYLIDNLLQSFPGIEAIAKKVGVSPTKIKNDFKAAHNQGIYQYYRSHQMSLANTLLSEKATTVKEVANLLGYENASKFAAVFKEQFGFLPSSIIKPVAATAAAL